MKQVELKAGYLTKQVCVCVCDLILAVWKSFVLKNPFLEESLFLKLEMLIFEEP